MVLKVLANYLPRGCPFLGSYMFDLLIVCKNIYRAYTQNFCSSFLGFGRSISEAEYVDWFIFTRQRISPTNSKSATGA